MVRQDAAGLLPAITRCTLELPISSVKSIIITRCIDYSRRRFRCKVGEGPRGGGV